jgi:hypothetical protein
VFGQVNRCFSSRRFGLLLFFFAFSAIVARATVANIHCLSSNVDVPLSKYEISLEVLNLSPRCLQYFLRLPSSRFPLSLLASRWLVTYLSMGGLMNFDTPTGRQFSQRASKSHDENLISPWRDRIVQNRDH